MSIDRFLRTQLRKSVRNDIAVEKQWLGAVNVGSRRP